MNYDAESDRLQPRWQLVGYAHRRTPAHLSGHTVSEQMRTGWAKLPVSVCATWAETPLPGVVLPPALLGVIAGARPPFLFWLFFFAFSGLPGVWLWHVWGFLIVDSHMFTGTGRNSRDWIAWWFRDECHSSAPTKRQEWQTTHGTAAGRSSWACGRLLVSSKQIVLS